MNLLSIDFLFKTQWKLLIKHDFNWNQFTFNSFESTFNWFSLKKQSPQKFLCTTGYHPNKYIHYWGWVTHGVPLKQLCGCCCLNKGLIRHLIIWETLHFQGFNMDMAFQSKWTSFTQRKVDKSFLSFHPKCFCAQ